MIRRFVLLLSLVLLVASQALPAFGGNLEDDLADVKAKMAALREEMDQVAADRSEIAQQVVDAQGRLDSAERAVTAAEAKVARITTEIQTRVAELDAVRADLAERFAVLAGTRAQLDTARTEAENWVVQNYMTGGPSQPSIAFSATAIVDVSVGVGYLETLTRASASVADRYAEVVGREEAETEAIRTIEQSLQSDVDALAGARSIAAELAADLDQRRFDLEKEYDRQAAILAEVEAAIEEFEGEIAGLAKEETSIRRKIAAATQRSSVRTQPSTSPGSGTLIRPVPGGIGSGFGMRVHPITGKTRMHNGVDMHANMGDPIKAAAPGTVILAGVKGGYGNTVMIDHGGGMVTLYAHQSKLLVTEGEHVEGGDVIGLIGSTGVSTGPHLHFEVRINGSPVDPAKYL